MKECLKMLWLGLKIGIGIGMVYISGLIDGASIDNKEEKKHEEEK